MKVIHVPYVRNNPYQKILIENLQKLGIKVKGGLVHRNFPLIHNILKDWKPDVIHLHWHHHFFLRSSQLKTIIKSIMFIAEVLLVKLCCIKLVWTIHNISSHEKKHLKLEIYFASILARFVDVIITHSETSKLKVQQVFGAKKNKVIVIPHGNYIDFYNNTVSRSEARQMLKLVENKMIFLFLGQIRHYKGVIDLVKAFHEFNSNSAELIIAGSPGNDIIIKEIKDNAERNSNIYIIPEFISDDKVQIYMNAADVVIFPYKDILTSGSIIFAMSFGKAIIAPRIGDIAEILDVTGSFLYNPDKKDGLLNSMKEAVASKMKIQKMGNHNLKLAKKHNWNDAAVLTNNVYK